jgi:Skp family chaperone for outer membrane proteins
MVLFPRPAAAQNRPAASGFASVEIQRVLSEYKGSQQAGQELESLRQGLTRSLERLDQGGAAFLPESELRDLANLYAKEKPADAEKTRISNLEQKASVMGDELTRLQNKATPTDPEKVRLAELAGLQQTGRTTLQTIQQEFQKRLSDREVEIRRKVANDVKAAIAKVAQEKNLAVVFDSQIAVYAANDITGDVVKQLNR